MIVFSCGIENQGLVGVGGVEVGGFFGLFLQLNVVGFAEQYDPHRPVVEGSATPSLSEVQEPHHLGRPGSPQHHLPLQPRYSQPPGAPSLMLLRSHQSVD